VNGTVVNVLLVGCFVLIGGVFAAAEIALVSLREGQLRSLAQHGKRGHRVARLAEDPNRFLAAVQVGITLAGFLSAAFGAATLAEDLSPALVGWGLGQGLADVTALVGITLVISYLSLVLGELAPKRLALQRAETLALIVGPMLDRVARISRPVIWLLSASTNVVVRLFGGDPTANRESIPEDELRDLVARHKTLGRNEREFIEEVFTAGERQLREVMVPRTEVDFLDAATPVAQAIPMALTYRHSRYPVVRGSSDEVVGFVHAWALFNPRLADRSIRVGDLARDVKQLPASHGVLPALSEMRQESRHMAIVVDEYGGTAGMVTLEDLVEELVGEISDEYDTESAMAASLGANELDVDGLLNVVDFADQTGVGLPAGPYETVAGFLVARLGHIPELGESTEVGRYHLTVTELDGRRVARVRLSTVEVER